MHSSGVLHNDIEPENIMFRGFQSFLIDFNRGSKMTENSEQCTFSYASRRCHKIYLNENSDIRRNGLEDYESFLYAMSKLHKVQLRWFKYPFHEMEPEKAFELCGKMKENTTDIIVSTFNSPCLAFWTIFSHSYK